MIASSRAIDRKGSADLEMNIGSLENLINSPKLITRNILDTPKLSRMSSKELEHAHEAIKVEQELLDVENNWKSCCLIVDRRALQFFTQLGISLIVISLCIYNLVQYPDNCDSNQVYMGLLTMTIGVYIPTPTMNKEK